jgi:hypothetical protein
MSAMSQNIPPIMLVRTSLLLLDSANTESSEQLNRHGMLNVFLLGAFASFELSNNYVE